MAVGLEHQFAQIFRGGTHAHGTYAQEDIGTDGVKKEIKATARTLREPPTPALWAKHLAGSRPIGIVPIDEAGRCWWGAVDVDVYDLDHGALVRRLREMSVPALVCRTKSGGGHVYLFFSTPVPASELMPRLRALAALLGYGDAEVFPKQDSVSPEKDNLGNWLNMPYYGGDETQRYAVREDGRGLSMESFLKLADAAKLDGPTLAALKLHPTVEGFETGPPCLETLAARGFGEGTRNNGLFALGVLAKKMRPDAWEALLEEWNRTYMTPPLAAAEVTIVVRGLRRKEYTYRCGDQPIVSFCNLALCRTRPHGAGAGGAAQVVESATVLKSDPPLFFVVLKTGGVVEVNAAQLLNPRDFQLAVLTQLQQVIPSYRNEDWLRTVQKVVENATVLDAPLEVGTGGKFMEILENFCTDRHAGETREDVLLGKPWRDDESGRVFFRLKDLEASMDRARFVAYSRGQVTTRIKELGGGTTQLDARGKNTRVWWVSATKLQWQTRAHPAPPVDESPI